MNPKIDNVNQKPAAVIGIDWADESHQVCLLPEGSPEPQEFKIANTHQAVTEFIQSLQSRFGGRHVNVCLEQSHGLLVYLLMQYEFIHIYIVNPASVYYLRKSRCGSGSKNDVADARLLMEYMFSNVDKLRRFVADYEEVQVLAILVKDRREFVEQRTKVCQSLQATLKNYFPEAIGFVGEDMSTDMAADFLLKWTTPQELKRSRSQTVRNFYYGHGCRRADVIEQRLKDIEGLKPAWISKGLIDAYARRVKALASQIRELNATIKSYDREINEVFGKHANSQIFRSFPGAGEALAPRLMVAFGGDKQRFGKAINFAQYCGIAPVVEQSGKMKKTHRRYMCHKFTMQTFVEYAGCSIRFCQWASGYYRMQRQRGKSHYCALRALAMKWIKIMWKCWHDGVQYDEEKYMESLKRTNSPLLEYMGVKVEENIA